MKATLRWMQVDPDTNEYMYDLGTEEIDTSQQSVRDTIVDLLLNKWDGFGSDGDCIVIKEEAEDDFKRPYRDYK